MVVAVVEPTKFHYFGANNGIVYFYVRYYASGFTGSMLCHPGNELVRVLADRPLFITQIVALISTTAANERSSIQVYDGGGTGMYVAITEGTDTTYLESFYGPWGPFNLYTSTSGFVILSDSFGEWSGNVSCSFLVFGRIYDPWTVEPTTMQPVSLERYKWPLERIR